MGRRVGAACSPDKAGYFCSRPRQGADVAVRWGGMIHGEERRKASSVLPPTRAVSAYITSSLLVPLLDFLLLPFRVPAIR